MRLQRRVALVTGSGRGIGRATALKLAAEGAQVVVNDLDEGPAKQVVDAIREAGGDASAYVGSVTAPDFAEGIVAHTRDRFDGLDIIVNNAGFTWDSVIQKMSDEQWDTMLDVHLKAPFALLRAAQPVIAELARADRTAGRNVPCRKVVNVSSVAGLRGNAGQSNYAAAKAGILGLTRTLSKEWGRYNVTVNAVAFGIIGTRLTETDARAGSSIVVDGREVPVGVNPDILAAAERMIPLGRAGTTDEAAGAIFLLCSPESDYVSGQTLVCGGGFEL